MTDLMKRLADALHTAATYLDMRSQAEWQQEVRALLRECAVAERGEVQPIPPARVSGG